jgi:NADPH-dependent 2,4-dienoyl-CoA reductase/sulfur reductase-like enzyme
VLVVGGSTAGSTALRKLRRRGFDGRLTLLDPLDGTHRPPLSKAVLADAAHEASVLMDLGSLDVVRVPSAAASLDVDARVVTDVDGAEHGYDALLVATGGRARRLATAASVVVVGAGFLGLEVATAARRTAATVTVIDPEPPLVRLLGDHLATVLVGRATDHGITLRRSAVRLHGSPVRGVELDDGSVLEADVVVTCAGDVPETAWLEGSGVAGPQGVPVDASCRTRRDDVWAAGDVAAPVVDGASVRRPLWANAVTQGRVAAASMLGHEVDAPVLDDYAWTEVAGTSVKVVGRLPCSGTPRVLEESADGGRLLAFGTDTVAAVGLRRPVPRLRRALAELKASGA